MKWLVQVQYQQAQSTNLNAMSKHSNDLIDTSDEMQPENNWILAIVVFTLLCIVALILYLLIPIPLNQ